MGTKNNPSKYDCYANAKPDEPMFVLLGRDPLAGMLVRVWADVREHAGESRDGGRSSSLRRGPRRMGPFVG